mmetsp:Transcript_36018/g.36267  ORF Transcript_36018/g.36267 Transcript_36018/m.36267 type:complete len:150 (+) Transcript_36018:546-995(+)
MSLQALALPLGKFGKLQVSVNLTLPGVKETTPATVDGRGLEGKNKFPGVQITGVRWNPIENTSLFDEIYDRLIERAEVDRWYDAIVLCVSLFFFTFGYAATRYSEKWNGSYPYTMIPFYVADKALCWAGLWKYPCFAGHIQKLGEDQCS